MVVFLFVHWCEVEFECVINLGWWNFTKSFCGCVPFYPLMYSRVVSVWLIWTVETWRTVPKIFYFLTSSVANFCLFLKYIMYYTAFVHCFVKYVILWSSSCCNWWRLAVDTRGAHVSLCAIHWSVHKCTFMFWRKLFCSQKRPTILWKISLDNL